MPLTQSGFEVIPAYGDPQIERLVVAGVSIAPGVRTGPVHTVLGWVAQEWNDTVEKLISGDCWGYAKRDIRGGSGYSNHASGTAIDLNAGKHPQYTYTLSNAQRKACQAIVAHCGGVVRWGGDFTPGSVDEQHWEIAPGQASKVAALAARIKPSLDETKEDDVQDADIEKIADRVIAKLRVMPLTVRNYATPPAGQDYEERKDRPFAVVIQDISAYASQASRRGK